MITFAIGCGVGILIGFVMFAFLSANREESRVRYAAPDMLAALEKLDEMRRDFFIPDDELGAIDGDSIRAFVEMYRAAITKAKGAQ